MEKIDIQNFKKYYQNNDGNGTVARVGHVNAVIDDFTEAITRDYVLEQGTFSSSTLEKIKNYTVSSQGLEAEAYEFGARVILDGSTNAYSIPIGFIQTSSPFLGVGSNNSNVIATDTLLDEVNSPLTVSALVTDSVTGDVFPVSFLTLNVDNNITTPDEYFIFVLGADALDFGCQISINVEIGVIKGSTVEYTVI